MFECYSCNKKYDNEDKAIKCCTDWTWMKYDEYRLSRKHSGIKPHAKTHNCPNVNHGGKIWNVWLKADEKCPMCDYIYMPR